jgi:peptide/nickel transport system permease protein
LAQAAPEVVGFEGAPGDPESAKKIEGKSPGRLFWERFKQDKLAFVGLFFIALLILLAVGSPLVAKFVTHRGPNDISLSREMRDPFGLPLGPNDTYLFGADEAGRDLFIRVIYGARTSLQVALVATGIAVAVGVVLGVIAGYYGGKIDTFISRTIDIILSMPLLVFALGIGAACGVTPDGCLGGIIEQGRLNGVIFIIAAFSWPYIARIVRGNTLSLREKEFIEASRSLGASNRRIMFREILPNLVAPIIVYTTLIVPQNILFEAALSFLGAGLSQDIPSWGGMLSQASDLFPEAWWYMFFPGLFLFLTTLAFNLVGDGLRDALDPRTGR